VWKKLQDPYRRAVFINFLAATEPSTNV